MSEQQFQTEVMDELKHLDWDAMYDKYEDRFIEFIYDHYPIGNGTMLINQMEDSRNFEDFVVCRLKESELIYE